MSFKTNFKRIDSVCILGISAKVFSKAVLIGVKVNVRKQHDKLNINISERFSKQCRKTKTKAITLTNHNRNKTQNEPIRKPSNAKPKQTQHYFRHSIENCSINAWQQRTVEVEEEVDVEVLCCVNKNYKETEKRQSLDAFPLITTITWTFHENFDGL